MDTLELIVEFSRLTQEQKKEILERLRAFKQGHSASCTTEPVRESYSSVLQED